MDLGHNWHPRFTEWAVRRSILRSPVVVVDAGVQGGFHLRWDHLGDMFEGHGFDPLPEAIAPLTATGRPNRHFHCMALGAEDGTRDIFVSRESTATSFYRRDHSRLDVSDDVTQISGTRSVPVRRLDGLIDSGAVSRPDFIKIDCEGAEPEILMGASEAVANDILAIELETTFIPNQTHPETHFWTVYRQLLPHGFVLHDLAFLRMPQRSYAERAGTIAMASARRHAQPAIFNVLFYRSSSPRSAEELVKRAMILELYGAVDFAFAEISTHAEAVNLPGKVLAAAELMLHRPSLRGLVRHVRESAIFRARRIASRAARRVTS